MCAEAIYEFIKIINEKTWSFVYFLNKKEQ
jgi:hypothetical protein